MSIHFFFTNEEPNFTSMRKQAEKEGYLFGHISGEYRFDIIIGQPNWRPSIPFTLCCTMGTCKLELEKDGNRIMTDGENSLVLMVNDGNVVMASSYYWCGRPASLLVYLARLFGIESEDELIDQFYEALKSEAP